MMTLVPVQALISTLETNKHESQFGVCGLSSFHVVTEEPEFFMILAPTKAITDCFNDISNDLVMFGSCFSCTKSFFESLPNILGI